MVVDRNVETLAGASERISSTIVVDAIETRGVPPGAVPSGTRPLHCRLLDRTDARYSPDRPCLSILITIIKMLLYTTNDNSKTIGPTELKFCINVVFFIWVTLNLFPFLLVALFQDGGL